jgi:hypothetical protein
MEWARQEEPRSAAIMFMTTEHLTLQNAKSTAMTASVGRASIFIGSVSAGIIALSLIASVTHLDSAFYTFGIILLSTLTIIGIATFDWILQSGIEDKLYAERIEQVRASYLEIAPELGRILASVTSSRRLSTHGMHARRWRVFRTVAGMIALVTAILAGSAAGMLNALFFGRSVIRGFTVDALVTVAVLTALLLAERRAWYPARQERLYGEDRQQPS